MDRGLYRLDRAVLEHDPLFSNQCKTAKGQHSSRYTLNKDHQGLSHVNL